MAPRGQNRDKLIEAMQTLSLTKGFPATTVDEVCAEAEVSKGSFYHHFETKEDIGHAALDGYFEGLVAALTNGSFTEIADPVERLHAFVKNAGVVCAGPLLRNGCMLGSFALDLAESDIAVRNKLANNFSIVTTYVAALIDNASEAADLHVASEQLAQQFLAIIEGSIVLAKAYADPKMLITGVDLFANHLELIFSQRAST